MIRLAEAGDAPQIAAIYRYFCEETPVSFEAVGPDAAEIASRIEKIRRKLPWLVDDRDGVIAGYAYASTHRERAAYRWTVEVAIYVHEEAPGHGRRPRALQRTLQAPPRPGLLQGRCRTCGPQPREPDLP